MLFMMTKVTDNCHNCKCYRKFKQSVDPMCFTIFAMQTEQKQYIPQHSHSHFLASSEKTNGKTNKSFKIKLYDWKCVMGGNMPNPNSVPEYWIFCHQRRKLNKFKHLKISFISRLSSWRHHLIQKVHQFHRKQGRVEWHISIFSKHSIV